MWLLDNDVRQALEAAIAAGAGPNAEQQAQLDATNISALGEGAARIFKSAGNTAEIAVTGVLTNKPNFMAMLFGGGNTTYSDIISAIGIAEQDPTIEKIVFAMDSPGGEISGLFELIETIEATTKPTSTLVSNTAASAAYAIATATDTIVAKNNSARFGSVGIVVDMSLNANKISITSTNAPNKRPDPSTEEGREVIRAELDEVHDLFATSIAKGRKTSVDKVNAAFGQGGMFLADEALRRGMIDSVTQVKLQSVTNTNLIQTADNGGDNSKVKVMDLAELKAKYPGVFNAAVGEGVTQGVTQERERVSAHLIMGEASGSLDTAVKACKDGTEMTPTMHATYSAAAMDRTDINAANEDDDAAAAAAAAANAEDDHADTDAEAIAAGIEARFGIDKEDK
jgi:ClpP class serine protease